MNRIYGDESTAFVTAAFPEPEADRERQRSNSGDGTMVGTRACMVSPAETVETLSAAAAVSSGLSRAIAVAASSAAVLNRGWASKSRTADAISSDEESTGSERRRRVRRRAWR